MANELKVEDLYFHNPDGIIAILCGEEPMSVADPIIALDCNGRLTLESELCMGSDKMLHAWLWADFQAYWPDPEDADEDDLQGWIDSIQQSDLDEWVADAED